jgi:hypothetical protein
VGVGVSVGVGLGPVVLVGKSWVEVGVVGAGEPGLQAAKISAVSRNRTGRRVKRMVF